MSLSNVNHQHHCSPSMNSLHAPRLCPLIHNDNPSPFQGDHDNNMSVLGHSLKLMQRDSRQKFPKLKEEHAEGRVLTEINAKLEGGGSKLSSLSSPPLKRKRPPKLDIPKSPIASKMVGFDEKFIKEESISFEGDHYGLYCKKGKKEIMEDTHKVTTNINGDDQQAFFGVFDGHGGRKAADFVAEKLGQNIMALMIKSGGQDGKLEQAVKAGYLATDKEFLEQGVSSGASCVTALIKDGCLVVGNAGDCRAVLSRSGNAEVLTCDHKPGTEKEKKRIENLGGYVDIHHGAWRVLGTLAVSRSIGDLQLKQWVSAEPDTRKLPITSECEYMIMASDGLWDKVSNQEAVDITRPFCINLTDNKKSCGSQQLSARGSMVACKKLVELSVSRGSLDDISVMVVDLRHFCRRKVDDVTASN